MSGGKQILQTGTLSVEDAFEQLRKVMYRDVEAKIAELDRRQKALDEREENLRRRDQALLVSGAEARQPQPASTVAATSVKQTLVEKKPSLFGRSQVKRTASDGDAETASASTAPAPARSSSFGGTISSGGQAEAASSDQASDVIDSTDPGSASNLRAKFERLSSGGDTTPRGSQNSMLRRAKSEGKLKFPVSVAADSQNRPWEPEGSCDLTTSGGRSGSTTPTPRSLFGERQINRRSSEPSVMKSDPMNEPSTMIDTSDPGSASSIRAQFEQKRENDELTPRKSWKAKTTVVPLPDGAGRTKVHVGAAVGGAYKISTAFNKPPPKRKSLKDLP